ncbi:MAG: aminotransferase class V-fold PLP-dependent enzyme [Bacteroidota bacterium]
MASSLQPIYLNTASCGLVDPNTLQAANLLYADMAHNSSTRSEEWRTNDESRIRQAIADFIGAPVNNVAMVPNFSWAVNGVVQSLHGTERVLLHTGDYPSLIEPFRISNFPITWVDAPDGFNIDVEKIEAAIRSHSVDIVALSHVQWTTGYMLDIKALGALCKQHGVLFIVDATQSLGANVINLSELNINVFAASNYKWMNAGFGTGILYIADAFLEKYPPVTAGNNSYKMAGDKWLYAPSARSYEPGHPNMFGLMVLEAAIAQKAMLGMAHIEQHSRHLAQLFLTGIMDTPVRILGDHTMANRCAIIHLRDENGLGDWIKQHNIVVTQRNGLLRVSMHFYNTEGHVQALIDCIKAKV